MVYTWGLFHRKFSSYQWTKFIDITHLLLQPHLLGVSELISMKIFLWIFQVDTRDSGDNGVIHHVIHCLDFLYLGPEKNSPADLREVMEFFLQNGADTVSWWRCCCDRCTYILFYLLGPNDAIWRQRSGSPLAQIMACCLMAPRHYLNQCWLCISKVEWHSSKHKFTRDTSAINHWNYLEN